MSDLAARKCAPCRGGTPPLRREEVSRLLKELDGWEAVDGRQLKKGYAFKDFRGALEFVNRIAEVAEAEGHHPDICFGWGRAEITIWTHDIGGLSENDFILAAKIDALSPPPRG